MAIDWTALAAPLASGFLLLAATGGWALDRKRLRALDQSLTDRAGRDDVTGLTAYAPFMAALDRRLCREADAEPGRTALLLIELTRIADIATQNGPDARDALLQASARRLKALAAPDGLVTRIADGRFLMASPGIADALAAALLTKRVIAALIEPADWNGLRLSSDAAIGLALAPTDAKDAAGLVQAADLARSEAVKSGRNSYRFFNAAAASLLGRRREMERIVKDAAARRLFHLDYQPVLALGSGKLTGFEALIRLRHPEHGLIPPAEFIPVAEETGLIDVIGSWSLNEACRTAAQWPDPLRLAVNLSPVQFRTSGLIASVRRALERARFPAYRLELEVTEGLLLENADYVREQLKALKDMGTRIVLDDFGSGWSSLSYLWQFAFQKIKIDRSFIAAMDDTPQARSILGSIVTLAHGLDLPVTAEGVETQAQADFLRRIGCDEVQGYFFGRPAPVSDLAAIILRDFTGPAETNAALSA